jgi:hypothetical protein
LAAVGVAMVIAPNWIEKIGTPWRWTIAAILLSLGVLGMRSSFTQHRDSDAVQRGLGEKIDILQGKSDKLQATVGTYGPKLDAIISHPDSPEQRGLALALRNELKPKIQVDEPTFVSGTPEFLVNAVETNIGGSIAKAVNTTRMLKIGPVGKESEDRLFRVLRDHEDDPDKKPADIVPGYAGRTIISISGYPPISPQDYLDKKPKDVVYVGILVTFFDEEGRQYHTEKCLYYEHGSLDRVCDGHNHSY